MALMQVPQPSRAGDYPGTALRAAMAVMVLRCIIIVLALWVISLISIPRQAHAEGASPVSTEPSHVGVKPWDELLEFITGTSGEFEIELYIVNPTDARGKPVGWDPSGTRGFLWLTAEEASGISFEGDAGSHERVVEFSGSQAVEGVITVKFPYSVSPHACAKAYRLRLDISAPLVSADGVRTQDAGSVSKEVRVDSSLRTKLIILAVLFVAVFLFIVEWVRVDVVAIMMMVSIPMLGLLSSKQALTGLSSNAVVAIIGVMIVGAGLNRVGLVSRAVKPLLDRSGGSPMRLMASLSFLIAMISSVMQNTGAAVLFLPGIRHACKHLKIPISSILMPIGMCAILGGTLTMIGTSPLILLNDILPEGVEKFGLLELTPIGLGFVVCGLVYFSTVGRYFLSAIAEEQKERGVRDDVYEHTDAFAFYHDLDGPFELSIPSEWTCPSDLTDTVVEIRRMWHVNIVGIADRAGIQELAPPPDAKINPQLSLCVYGPEAEVRRFAEVYRIDFREQPEHFKELFNPAVAGTVEAVLSPRSRLIGSTIKDIGFRTTFGVSVLALYREGKTYYKEMSDMPLSPGDALLLQSTWEHFYTLQGVYRNLQIIIPLEVEIQQPRKAKAAVVCFLITIALMLVSSLYFQKLPYNPIPLSICLMAGAVLMVVTGVLTIQDAYAAVDWRTVFLLGGLISLGMAVDRTGTAEWIATSVMSSLSEGLTPFVLILMLACLSWAFCLVISNVGACTLLVPLGASMAVHLGVDPRVAAIVVGLGVSNSFFLPTHQVNALYMGSGGYQVKDYMRIGGPMSALYISVLVTMTYFFYL
jgi:di/tricarboxylate transporter